MNPVRKLGWGFNPTLTIIFLPRLNPFRDFISNGSKRQGFLSNGVNSSKLQAAEQWSLSFDGELRTVEPLEIIIRTKKDVC